MIKSQSIPTVLNSTAVPPAPPRRGASSRVPIGSSPPGRGKGVGWFRERNPRRTRGPPRFLLSCLFVPLVDEGLPHSTAASSRWIHPCSSVAAASRPRGLSRRGCRAGNASPLRLCVSARVKILIRIINPLQSFVVLARLGHKEAVFSPENGG